MCNMGKDKKPQADEQKIVVLCIDKLKTIMIK